MSDHSQESSLFCLLMPEGKAAISTIWIRGPLALRAVEHFFRPNSRRRQREFPVGTLAYGTWAYGLSATASADESRDNAARAACEDVVVDRIDATTFEVHIHGGHQSRTLFSQTLQRFGLRSISHEEYFLATTESWIGAQIMWQLTKAETERTACAVLAQLPIWQVFIDEIRGQFEVRNSVDMLRSLRQVCNWKAFGIHLTTPWVVAVIGEPNVGKSSLVNALAGFPRTIVHDLPGTTRDLVTQPVVFDGWPVMLTDTAGLRAAQSEIEQQGIDLARQVSHAADCRLAVFDATNTWTKADQMFLGAIQPEVIVFNKVDRLRPDSIRPPGIYVSALEGQGIDELEKEIARTLVPNLPPLGQPIPVNGRHAERICELIDALELSDWEQVGDLLTAITTSDAL